MNQWVSRVFEIEGLEDSRSVITVSPSVIKWQHSWNSEKVSEGAMANGGGVSRKMGWWSQVGKRKKKIAEADVNNNFWRSIHVLCWIHADWLNIVLGLRASNQCVLFSVGRVPMYDILKFVYDISSGTKCEQHLQCKFAEVLSIPVPYYIMP